MSSVDDRIVNMQFNNKQFTEGVTQSQKSLDSLEQSLNKTAQSKGLASMDQQVGGLRQKFSAMQVAGVAAVATIASKATSAGLNFVKSLTLDPIMQGFQEYQTNLNSIQTVMSNTGLVGEKGMKKVNNALDELNHYSDLTIYNFSEMARNVGTFTAAGVKLKPAVSAIKGIANLAALSGSSSQQASTAMYQLSQAIAAGRVNLQDWNSVVNAGMGGKQFQTALARTAVAMGKISQKSVQVGDTVKVLGKSFRESIGGQGPHWLDSKILVATLDTLDGRFSKSAMQLETNKDGTRKYTDAQIEARIQTNRLALAKKEDIKFTDKQFAAVRKQADAAATAATQVKTLPQLVGVVRESMGSIWSTFFRGVLGTYTQSVNLWTKVGNVVQRGTNALNNSIIGMVTTWADSGRRLIFIESLGKIFKDLGAIMGAMKGAWDEVFPVHGGQTLIKLTDRFAALVNVLTPTKKTIANLRDIFGGVFAVLHIGVSIISAIASGFGAFFGEVFKGSSEAGGGILDFAAHIGDLLKQLDKFLTSGGKMKDLFRGFGKVAGVAVGQFIQIGTNIVQGLIKGLSGGALSSLKGAVENIANFIPDRIKALLGIHSPATTMIPIGENIIMGIIRGIDLSIRFIMSSMGKIYSAIFGGIKQAFGGMNALDFASLLNAVFATGLIITMTKISKALNTVLDWKQLINSTFGELQKTLKTFQQGIKAKALKDIAIAVGILTASLVALSFIDPKKLAIGLGGISAMLGLLVGSLATLSKVSKGDVGIVKLAGSMLLIASAMTILSAAIVILGHQDIRTLGKGIGALAFAMGIMAGALKILGTVSKVSLRIGPTLILTAIAMNILAGAIALFGKMNLSTLAKGLGAMFFAINMLTSSLVALGTFGPTTFGAAASIVAVAGAMAILSGVVLAFGKMKIGTLVKGIGSMYVVIGLLTSSLVALGSFGPATFGAAASILAVASAMVLLVPVIATLGSMDIGTLAKGLVAFGAVILLFSAAIAILGAIALEVGPGLLMLGGALALIGLGMAAFGVGFALLAATGTAGIAVMTAAITAFIMLLPSIAIQMAAALVTFLETIAAAAPRVRAAMGTIFAQLLGVITDAIPQIGALISKLITTLIQVILKAIPQIGQVFSKLIATGINVIKRSIPRFIEAGYTIIDRFIGSVAKHVPHIVDEAANLISGFLRAIGKASGRIADAGLRMIVDFINGVATAIDNNAGPLRTAGLHLAGSIIDGMTGGLLSTGLTAVKNAAQKIADALPGWMRKVLGIRSPSKVTRKIGQQTGEGLSLGIDDSRLAAGRSARELGKHIVKNVATGISKNLQDAVNAAVQMANAVLAAGDPGVLAAAGTASEAQKRADFLQAQAALASADAKKVSSKKNPKLARKLKRAADRAQAAADAAQAQADAAAQNATDLKDFNSSDLHTKGDKMNEQATALAAQAQKIMAKANAEAAKAVSLGRKHAKEAAKLRQQAQADALEAARLANAAQAANAQANAYYAQEVNARIDAIVAAREAEKKAAADQAAYDAADTQGKIDILNKRIAEQQAIADKKNADAAALLDKARAEANSNAAQAMLDLDASEQAAQDAKDAADAAQQTKDQLAQLMGGDSGLSGGSGGGTTIQPSRSVLEDAASAMDRYTASMVAAQEAMAAQPTVIQYEQNNYSPEALSASEVYRQTRNLLSTKEVKMGSN